MSKEISYAQGSKEKTTLFHYGNKRFSTTENLGNKIIIFHLQVFSGWVPSINTQKSVNEVLFILSSFPLLKPSMSNSQSTLNK